MTTGLIVALAVLVLGIGIGLWHRRQDGRFRSTPATPASASAPAVAVGAARSSSAAGLASSAAGPASSAAGLASSAAGPASSLAGLASSAAGPGDAAGQKAPAGSGDASVFPAADGTLPIVGVGPVDARTGPETLDRELLAALGVGPAQATLLQFSSAFCAPCRALRRVSSEVALMVTGVQHVEVDAESHLEAVRALGIWRTPTLLVLDAEGRVVKRATGVPGKPQLIAVLGEILPG